MKMKLGKDSGHIHLPVFVNEAGPFDFTLDTGAGMTVISKALADQLGVETYEGAKVKAAGVGGTPIPVRSAKVKSISLGTEIFRDKEVVVINRGPIAGSGCFTPGIIGHDVLKDYIILIDYRSLTVIFEKHPIPKILDKRKEINWIPFQYVPDTHLMKVPVCINGEGPFELILDTGASGTVITPSIANELGFVNDSAQNSGQQTAVHAKGCDEGVCIGPAGVATGYGAVAKTLSVGTATQKNMQLGVIDLKVVSPKGEKIDYGVLGYPFLKNYTLVIDYPNNRFALVN